MLLEGFHPVQPSAGFIRGGDQHPRQGPDPGGQETVVSPLTCHGAWTVYLSSVGQLKPQILTSARHRACGDA